MPRVDSMHKEPVTPAEKLARHLEMNYGIQLDTYRHRALVSELEDFLAAHVAVALGIPVETLTAPEPEVLSDAEPLPSDPATPEPPPSDNVIRTKLDLSDAIDRSIAETQGAPDAA